jgi:hypothetical protein
MSQEVSIHSSLRDRKALDVFVFIQALEFSDSGQKLVYQIFIRHLSANGRPGGVGERDRRKVKVGVREGSSRIAFLHHTVGI